MKITAEMIDWDAYRKSVEGAIELKEELECIADGDYDEILDKYDYDVMKDYLK